MVRTIKHRHTGGSVPAIFVWDSSLYANALWGIFVPQFGMQDYKSLQLVKKGLSTSNGNGINTATNTYKDLWMQKQQENYFTNFQNDLCMVQFDQ